MDQVREPGPPRWEQAPETGYGVIVSHLCTSDAAREEYMPGDSRVEAVLLYLKFLAVCVIGPAPLLLGWTVCRGVL